MTLADKLRGTKIISECPVPLEPQLLLQPNIPKPLHGVAPRVILGQSWWDATRKAAYASTDFHCLACGVHKCFAEYHAWLEGHEQYDINYEAGRAKYVRTVPLCHFCHNSIHDGRLKALLDRGEIHHAKYVAIIQHRDRVLATAGLKKSSVVTNFDEQRIAEWGKWRLILFGKKYKPLYKTFDEWKLAHGGN